MKHRILVLEIDTRLFETHSLKEKRSLKRQLFERLAREKNISIAETDHLDLWQRLTFTVAYVAVDETTAEQMAETLRRRLDDILGGNGEVLTFDSDIL